MQPGRRDALIVGGLAAAAALSGALVGALLLQSRSGAAQLLSASFHDLAGRERRLLEWKDKALLCNFWATWCAPCREEVPLLVAAKQAYHDSPLEIVGIGIDSADKMREFAAIYKINYPILVADASAIELMRKLGNPAGALPYTVLLDRSGALVHRKLGALGEAELATLLEQVLR